MASCLLRERSPRSSATRDFGTAKQLASSRSSSALAAPSTGAAAMPTLSALSGALEFGRVGTVIENEQPDGWQPFDPRDLRSYRWLEEYGVEVRLGGTADRKDSPP